MTNYNPSMKLAYTQNLAVQISYCRNPVSMVSRPSIRRPSLFSAREDVFIINVGDLLNKWTKGVYRIAMHRVVNVSEADRYVVLFFYHGNLKTKLQPLDESGYGEEETVEEHIKGMFRKTCDS